MCIIAIKPAGRAMPDTKTLQTMFRNNPDGAGFMWGDGKRVNISKGFMTYADFSDALDKWQASHDPQDYTLVMHFRITTHGGTSPQNCHPFPLTDDVHAMQELITSARVGIAHNGIIYSVKPRDGISDTMEFIATHLCPLARKHGKFYASRVAMDAIENSINGSRMVFLTPDGRFYTVGAWATDNGILYSNNSYAPRVPVYSSFFTAYDVDDEPRTACVSTVRQLCFVDDISADTTCLVDACNDYVCADSIAIDSFGRAYVYDYDTGCAYREKSVVFIGRKPRFNPRLAKKVYCYRSEEEHNAEWYGEDMYGYCY